MRVFLKFIDRGEGREREKERNKNVWLLLAHPPLGTWPPGTCLWLEIAPAMLSFTGPHSIH